MSLDEGSTGRMKGYEKQRVADPDPRPLGYNHNFVDPRSTDRVRESR